MTWWKDKHTYAGSNQFLGPRDASGVSESRATGHSCPGKY